MKRTLLCVCGLFLLASCFERPVNPGEIAFVNGAPITLKQLQAAHDAVVLAGDSPSREPSELQKEYGELLSELIVQELVIQELDRAHIPVTEEELDAEVALVRSDFAEGEFERMLLEESISLENWRGTLGRSLAMRKFWSQVLRGQVAIAASEVEEYYLQHQESFQVPEAVRFIQISGMVGEQIAAAAERFKQAQDAAAVQSSFGNLTVRELVVRVDRLAPEQLSGLAGLGVLQSSPVLELNGEFFSVILLEREKSRTMTRTETYALIEGMLLEEKTQVEFDKWVSGSIAKSSIKVSTHLIPENLR